MGVADLPTMAEVEAARRGKPLTIVPRRGRRRLQSKKVCPVCQQSFQPWGTRQIACSPKCGGEARRLKTRSARPCSQCGVKFLPRRQRNGAWQKLCSAACRSERDRPSMITVTCSECFRTFRRIAGKHSKRYRRQFCNAVCRSKFVRGENHALYRGDCDPNRGRRWVRLANSIRERDSHQCRRCGKSESDNGRKLDVDHVLPWRSFEDKALANNPRNLVALCKQCHNQKTTIIEPAWLRGDGLAMQQYRTAVGL